MIDRVLYNKSECKSECEFVPEAIFIYIYIYNALCFAVTIKTLRLSVDATHRVPTENGKFSNEEGKASPTCQHVSLCVCVSSSKTKRCHLSGIWREGKFVLRFYEE